MAGQSARGIVTEVDACSALLPSAACIIQAVETQRINRERLAYAVALLMLVRDHVRPRPDTPRR